MIAPAPETTGGRLTGAGQTVSVNYRGGVDLFNGGRGRVDPELKPQRKRHRSKEVKLFEDYYLEGAKGHSKEEQNQNYNRVQDRLREEMVYNDDIRIVGEDCDVDLDAVWEQMEINPIAKKTDVHEYWKDVHKWGRLTEAERKNPPADYVRLVEHVIDAMDNSMFGRFLGDCTVIGSWQLCRQTTCDDILGMIPTVNVECDQIDLASDPALPEIDLDCASPNEETKWYGLNPPLKLCIPERCKQKLAFGYKRELCPRFRPAVEREMRNGALLFREAAARTIVKMLFNLYPPGQNRWQFCMDGHNFEPFYTQATAGAPWVNDLVNNQDLDRFCNRNFFHAMDAFFRNVRDPRDGRRMSCCDNKQIISPHADVAELLPPLLRGPIQYGRTTGDTCAERMAFETGPKLGYDPNVVWSICLEEMFEEELNKMRCAQGLTALTPAQMEQAKKRTAFVGCVQQFMAWMIEWQLESMTRTGDTWENFNQEIIFAIKYIWKVGGLYTQPWAGLRVNGLTFP